jgi:branched-chain amino acid transport system substrate-binding protein
VSLPKVSPWLTTMGLMLLLAGCAPRAEPIYREPAPVEPAEAIEPLPVGPVKVALLLPLSGNAAAVGQDMLEAAQIALFDVGRTDMVLLPRDTGGTIEGAAAAARSAIEEGAELILGPLFGNSTSTVAGIAREHDLKVISFSNDAAVAGDNVWVVGFRPEEQVVRVVDFARRQGLTRIGALAPDDAYGARAINGFREAIGGGGAAAGGLGSPTHAFYPADEREAARVVREFTGYVAPPPGSIGVSGNTRRLDGLLIADGGSRLRSIAALLAFYDVDTATTRPLGTMLWESDPRLLFEETLQGGWYASVSPEGERNFQARFERAFGRQPGALAGLAYDATALAAVVAASDRSFPRDLLIDPSGFVGRAGIFRLRGDGTTEHGLAVLEIDNGTARVVEPAPSSFLVALLGQ